MHRKVITVSPYARRHQLSGSLLYHAYNRSNTGAQIFFDEKDYLFFICILRKYSQRFGLKIYHWAIMPNHYHLLIEINEPEQISKVMAGINICYSRYHHKRYHGLGFLWQGRFKSQPIQKEKYLLACGRYIERNPVRKGLVKEAKDCPYSSAKHYCLGTPDGLTVDDPLMATFGLNDKQRKDNYSRFLLDFNEVQEAAFSSLNVPCADKNFINKLVKINGHFFPKRQGNPAKIFLS